MDSQLDPTDADGVGFRPLASADLPRLQRWLAAPHVDRWWHGPQDLQGVRTKYQPRIDGREPTHIFVIELATVPVGWIQWYRWADYLEHAASLGAPADSAGVDLAIGERDQIGRGLGPRVLRAFLERIVFAAPAVTACISDPETANTRSVRAFAKAGFFRVATIQLPSEPFTREVLRCDRRHPSR